MLFIKLNFVHFRQPYLHNSPIYITTKCYNKQDLFFASLHPFEQIHNLVSRGSQEIVGHGDLGRVIIPLSSQHAMLYFVSRTYQRCYLGGHCVGTSISQKNHLSRFIEHRTYFRTQQNNVNGNFVHVNVQWHKTRQFSALLGLPWAT